MGATSTQRRLASVATALLLLTGIATAVAGPTQASSSTVVLQNQVVPNLASYPLVHHSDPSAPVQIGVALAGPNQGALATYAKQVLTPGSAEFHHFLSPAQRAARFGVDRATVSRVTQVLAAHGMRVAYASPDGTYLLLAGTVGAVERTFAVTEDDHRGADGSVFRANRQPPTVPVGVATVIGLTSLEVGRRSQDICVQGTCTGTVKAEDLWAVYDQPGGDQGTGQSVGIIGEGDLDGPVGALRSYESFKGFPQVPVRRVYVNDDKTDTAGLPEWIIDETAITGMAPNLASLSYYFGNDLTMPSYIGALQAWSNDPNGPVTASSSIDSCEMLLAALGEIPSFDALLQGLVVEGRTLFNATGDTGGSCTVPALAVNGVSNSVVPSVAYPASSPYVVAVGGTVLYTTASEPPARAAETAWTHTGGGTSVVEPAPPWQQDMAVVAGRCATTPGLGAPDGGQCRGLPDVAALSGDIFTNGYETGSGTEGGGTSLSAPLWAGMWARVLAAHPATCAAAGAPGPIGLATPALYQVAKDPVLGPNAFSDIAVGSNGQWSAIPRNPADPTGWDYVSGFGSPALTQIMGVLDCGNLAPVATNPVLQPDVTIDPATFTTCVNGVATDPTGDATVLSGLTPGTAAVNDSALDLDKVTISATAAGLTWSNHVVNLAADSTDLAFEDYFSYLGQQYDLVADNGAPTGPPSFSMVQVDPTTGAFTTVIPTLAGSFDTATNTVSIVLPFSAFNDAAHPATLLGAGASLGGLTVNADRVLGGLLTPADEALFGCPYSVPTA